MVKIGLLSDTHSYIDEDIYEYFKDCDEIWHAGDVGNVKVIEFLEQFKPLRGVYGNIDNHIIRRIFPLNNRFTIEGLDVWITHIGGYPKRYDKRIKEEIKANPPDLFISGHSHICKVIYDKSLSCLHMNPGAYGQSGFHAMRTALRFNIEDGQVKNLEVIEAGKRGVNKSSIS